MKRVLNDLLEPLRLILLLILLAGPPLAASFGLFMGLMALELHPALTVPALFVLFAGYALGTAYIDRTAYGRWVSRTLYPHG